MKTLHRMAWVLPALCGMMTVQASEPAVIQEMPQRVGVGGTTHVEFAAADHRLAMVSLQDRLKTEWAGPSVEKASIWKLAMRGPGAATAELASGDAPFTVTRSEGGQVRFTWKTQLGVGLAQVQLTVKGDEGGGLLHWQLSAHVTNGWKVVRADWPILSNVRTRPELKLAVPYGWGLEYDVKPGMDYEGTYPSMLASMPFVAFYCQGSGLYVGMHDKRGGHKHLAVKAREDGVSVTCTHWPSEADTADGRYYPRSDVVVGTFAGDYWNAAQICRAFNRETVWGGGGKSLRLSNPKESVPAWLKDIDLWLIPPAEPLKNVDACRKAGEFFGVPIALHWYGWHEIPFDTLYPEYFPPKPNFREGVKALQQAGFRVMPYINGRLCDPKSKTWTQEGGDKAAAHQENGQPYTETYGSKVALNVMCPATKFWQDKVGGIVGRLIREFGVDGVYIDQIGAAGAVRCFNPEHGHSPGGGTFWFDGYRTMLDEIRAKLPKDRMITTEENAECWNDQLDALLMVNTPSTGDRRMIPLMPAVYGGRIITFGFQYMSGDDVPKSLPFRAKMGRAFLWGSQLGWMGVEMIMADNARKEAEFLRNLARARHGAHEFLLNGTFLGEAEVTGDNPRLHSEATGHGGKYTIDLPAVMATAWLAADGTVGLAVVNMSDQARSVEIRPPWRHLMELENTSAGDRGITVVRKGQGPESLPITIPAGDARIVRVGAGTRPS